MPRNFWELFGMSPEPKPEREELVVELPGNVNDGGKFNKHSGTWAFVKHWAEEELDKCRKKNDISLSMEKTATIRGEIKILKKLKSLAETIQ